jgi:predicted MFS family arabinose efflux permease
VGGSLVGGSALAIAERTSAAWVPAAVVGGALLGCSLALLFVGAPQRPASRPRLAESMRELGRELRGLLWSRGGLLAVGLCLLPIGSGGALGLFSAMAEEWQTGADLVSFANGFGGGLAAMVGALLGGRLSDAIERRRAYALSGVVIALVAFAMAVLPRSASAYVGCVLAYNVAIGLCYATFAGFVLEIIGKGAAATKYNVFASLSNMPIYAMTRIDGWVAQEHGRTPMLWVGAAGVAGAALLLLLVFAIRPRRENA